MPTPVTASLHELVLAMDGHSDRLLARRFGADHNLFVFLSPLREGPLDLTRLAQRLNLTRAAVSKRVPLLERDGWVRTTSDPGHGRRVLVSLTGRGAELVEEASALLNQRFAGLLAGLGIDAEALNDHLRLIIAAIRALPEED